MAGIGVIEEGGNNIDGSADVSSTGAGDVAHAVAGATQSTLDNAPGSSRENPLVVGSIEEAIGARAGYGAGEGPWVKISGPSPWEGYPKKDRQ